MLILEIAISECYVISRCMRLQAQNKDEGFGWHIFQFRLCRISIFFWNHGSVFPNYRIWCNSQLFWDDEWCLTQRWGGGVMSGPDLQTKCYNSLPLTVQFAVDLPGQPAVTAVLQSPLWEEEHENWLCDPFNSITGSFKNMEIQMLEIFVMY